jgi:hypothetical protein
MFDGSAYWSGCLDDLHHHLASAYRIQDRQATEILLSALLDCPRASTLWFTLETNFYRRDCQLGWFSFGEHWAPRSLGEIRARRPHRDMNREITAWLNDQPEIPRLFIEPDFNRRPRVDRLPELPYLLGRCLRLHTITAPNGATLPVDERAEHTRSDQLGAYTRHVLEDRIGARSPDPPAFREPPGFLYSCELAQRAGAWFRDWGELASWLRTLGVRHAYLHGRTEVAQDDWAAMARVLRDSIPPWVRRAIEHLRSAPDQQASQLLLTRAMRLDGEDNESANYAKDELGRLAKQSILQWGPIKKVWRLHPQHAQAVIETAAGRAFGAALGTPAPPSPSGSPAIPRSLPAARPAGPPG